jgi:hypothetical protein
MVLELSWAAAREARASSDNRKSGCSILWRDRRSATRACRSSDREPREECRGVCRGVWEARDLRDKAGETPREDANWMCQSSAQGGSAG